MPSASAFKILDPAFFERAVESASLPALRRLVLCHAGRVESLVDVLQTVWLVSSEDGHEIWQETDIEGAGRHVRRLFRFEGSEAWSNTIAIEVAAVLVRSRWPHEEAREIVTLGLIGVDLWDAELARFHALTLFNREAAQTSEAAKTSRVLEMAKSLGLNPQPHGNGSHNWVARCPRRDIHPLLISTKSDEWGCPYCAKNGSADDLKVFADEINAIRDAEVAARPQPPVVEKPKRIKVLKRVTVSVEWGYDDHSITISVSDWQRIVDGHKTEIRGEGYCYEGEFFQDYWAFGGGIEGPVIVTYEGGGTGFQGDLTECRIEDEED